MGLRCLLGHDFGPAEVERERQEEGNEMVVTIREVETCTRCGEQQIVSENKEITSIRSAADVGLDESSTTGASSASDVGEAQTGDATADPATTRTDTGSEGVDVSQATRPTESPATGDATDDSAVFIDDDGAEVASTDEAGVAAEGGTIPEGETGADGVSVGADGTDDADTTSDADATGETTADAADAPSAEADDGVILDAESDRQAGEWEDADAELERPSTDVDVDAELAGSEVSDEEDDAEILDAEPDGTASTADAARDEHDGPVPWPEHEDVAADDPSDGPTPWPETEGEDEGFTADPSDGSGAGVSFGGGITPQRNGSSDSAGSDSDSNARTEYVEAPSQSKPTGEGFVHPSNQQSRRSANTSATEFYCANCESVWPAGRSSMRPGDICPECHKGYVGERDR